MSEEIVGIIKQNMIKILENTVPEKREETQALLNSIMEEIIVSIAQVEKNMKNMLDKIQKIWKICWIRYKN